MKEARKVTAATDKMGLREFVGSALTEILNGVADAQKDKTVGEFVADTEAAGLPAPKAARLITHRRGYTTVVEFDIAVTASSKQSGGASGSAAIWVINAELGGKTERQNETISHLQFSIPVALPDPLGKAAKRDDERKNRTEAPPVKGIA